MPVHISPHPIPDAMEKLLAMFAEEPEKEWSSAQVYDRYAELYAEDIEKLDKHHEDEKLKAMGRTAFSWICDRCGTLKQFGVLDTVGTVYASKDKKSKDGFPKAKTMAIWKLRPGAVAAKPYETDLLTTRLRTVHLDKLKKIAQREGITPSAMAARIIAGYVSV